MAELSVRYATALFEMATAKGLLDEYMEQSFFLRDLLQEKDCLDIIGHPQISTADKRAFFKKVFEGNIHSDLLGFLYLVVSKNRESYLIPALSAFIEMGERQQNKAKADLITAADLDDNQVLRIKELLSAKLNKEVEVHLKQDASLIGGFCIYVDGYFIDCTIKKQLKDMIDFIKRSAPNGSET